MVTPLVVASGVLESDVSGNATIPSFSRHKGVPLVVFLLGSDSDNPPIPSDVSGGLAWNPLEDVSFSTLDTPTVRLGIYNTLPFNTHANGILLEDGVGGQTIIYVVAELRNALNTRISDSDWVVQTAHNIVDGADDATLELGAPVGSNNHALRAFGIANNVTTQPDQSNPEAVKLIEIVNASPDLALTIYHSDLQVVTINMADTSDWGGVAFEIAAGATHKGSRGPLFGPIPGPMTNLEREP